jgi:hypothetical protein
MKKDTEDAEEIMFEKNSLMRRILRGRRTVTVNEKPITGIHNHEIKKRRDSI